MSIEQFYPFLLALGSGAWFGFFWWITQYFDPTKETVKFSLPVLGITIVYAAIVGLYFTLTGVEVNITTVTDWFAKNTVIIIFLQRGTQTIWRRFFGNTGEVEL